jgi:hypothetical protein
MHPWQIWVDLVQDAILALTFGALLWYAIETMRHRKMAASQLRLSMMPLPQVVFHRAPDKVFVRNMGPGAATRVILQGFWFRWGQQRSRCTFSPVGGMLYPRGEVVLDLEIESEDGQALEDRHVLEVAFRNAWQGMAETLVLQVYAEDVLGHCYKSEVRISRRRFATFRDGHGDPNWALEMGRPELLRPCECSEAPPLLDTTAPMPER